MHHPDHQHNSVSGPAVELPVRHLQQEAPTHLPAHASEACRRRLTCPDRRCLQSCTAASTSIVTTTLWRLPPSLRPPATCSTPTVPLSLRFSFASPHRSSPRIAFAHVANSGPPSTRVTSTLSPPPLCFPDALHGSLAFTRTTPTLSSSPQRPRPTAGGNTLLLPPMLLPYAPAPAPP